MAHESKQAERQALIPEEKDSNDSNDSNDSKNPEPLSSDVKAFKEFLMEQLPLLIGDLREANEDVHRLNGFSKFARNYVEWVFERKKHGKKNPDILNIIENNKQFFNKDEQFNNHLENLKDYWETVASLTSASVEFSMYLADKVIMNSTNDSDANDLNSLSLSAKIFNYSCDIINTLCPYEGIKGNKNQISSFLNILKLCRINLNLDIESTDSMIQMFNEINVSFAPAIVFPPPTYLSGEPIVNTRFITSGGYIGYSIWAVAFFPFALIEGVLRGLEKLGEQLSNNSRAIFLAKIVAFPFLVTFWPSKAIEVFPKKTAWMSGLIRLTSLMMWVMIGIFVFPPILGELGWTFTVANVGPFFSLLQGIKVTSTDVLIGICVGSYALFGQIIRTVLDRCFIKEENISPKPIMRNIKNSAHFTSPALPIRSIDPLATYADNHEPSTKPPSYDTTPLPTPQPTPAKSSRGIGKTSTPLSALSKLTQGGFTDKVSMKRKQDKLNDSPTKSAEDVKSSSAPTSSGNSSDSDGTPPQGNHTLVTVGHDSDGTPPQRTYTSAEAATSEGQFNTRDIKRSEIARTHMLRLPGESSVVKVDLGEGRLNLDLLSTGVDHSSSTNSTSDSTTSSSSFSTPRFRKGFVEDE